tara:strand:+ start:804 stop:1022 length:219 start_codon:yes stop_codon:yes gene_type:complete
MPTIQLAKNPISDFSVIFPVIQQFNKITRKDQRSVLKIQAPIFEGPLALCRIKRYFHTGSLDIYHPKRLQWL